MCDNELSTPRLLLGLVILRHKTHFQICLLFSQTVKTYVLTKTHFAFYYTHKSNKGKYLMMETVGIAPQERAFLLQTGNVEIFIIFILIVMKYVLFTKNKSQNTM